MLYLAGKMEGFSKICPRFKNFGYDKNFGLGEVFEVDFEDTCTETFLLMSMGDPYLLDCEFWSEQNFACIAFFV